MKFVCQQEMMIASSIVTNLIQFTEYLAIPTARFEYKFTVGICLPCESLRGDPSRLNQEKLRSVHSALPACSSLPE